MVVGAGVRVGTAGYLRCCVGGRWSLGLGVRAMSDFKVGDKIRRPTWNREFWMQVEWVGDFTYAGRREGGQDCMISRNDEVELWTPPFPFIAGEWITDGRGEHKWLVVGPSKDPDMFLGRIWTKTGGLREDIRVFMKESKQGAWRLTVPPFAPFPFKAGDVLRRSGDTDGTRWHVLDPKPGSEQFRGSVGSLQHPCNFEKKCYNGEWVLCPKQETWTVTTEDRRPMLGDRYMLDGEVIVATGNHRSTSTGRPVIVKITRNKE